MPSSASSTPSTPTLSLHDALPIWPRPTSPPPFGGQIPPPRRDGYRRRLWNSRRLPHHHRAARRPAFPVPPRPRNCACARSPRPFCRSEEHTSELQSRRDLVCRLLLPPPPPLPLFPYTTLFRSGHGQRVHPRLADKFHRLVGMGIDAAFGIAAAFLTIIVLRADQHSQFPLDHAIVLVRVVHDPFADRKSTRLNSSHVEISYAVFCFLHPLHSHSFPTRRSSDLATANESTPVWRTNSTASSGWV